MARTSNSRAAIWLAAWSAIAIFAAARPLAACPFCTALGPTLAQQRGAAAVVALAEVESVAGHNQATLRLHKILKGAERIGKKHSLTIELDMAAKPGSLVLVFGSGAASDGKLAWQAVGVNETSYAYFARSPSLEKPTAERLRYFGPFLEHADPLVAEDAYLEFGHAPFDEVARAADVLPLEKLRDWLVDPRVPQARKGFYGLAVGLRASGDDRRPTSDFLRGLVVAPEDDFRAGFDGILGGYLLLSGQEGLELVESRYLANPSAADGDVRHALTALRFYHEYGREIPPARLAEALARLLARGEFSAAAITDLARWKDWNSLAQVVAVYSRKESDEQSRCAVIGYLLASPEPDARTALERLRKQDPRGVAAAEEVLAKTSSLPASGD